jgi:hypothetical protein
VSSPSESASPEAPIDLDSSFARLRTSNSLIIVQSRLHAPSYAGPGRWIIVDVASKRSFLATGPDVVPEVFRVLADACGGFSPDRRAYWLNHAEARVTSLASSGLLVESICPERSLASLYHQFAYDYPFQDYGAPDWREADRQLMEQYASISPPPPIESTYHGELVALKEIRFEQDFGTDLDAVRSWTSAERLAFLLKFVFAKIGEVSSAFMTCPRRTSPSGGARHPTDAIVELSGSWPDLPSGAYHYDATRHALVATEVRSVKPGPRPPCVLTFVSTVERAMWRYRDVRSYRPVLVDLGHIAEMTALVSEFLGFKSDFALPIQNSDSSLDWMERPEFVCLEINEGQAGAGVQPSVEVDSRDLPNESPKRLLVNPLAYFSTSDVGIVGKITWPSSSEILVSADDFKVLNHCIPSQRGDRDISWLGICASTGVSSERLSELYEAKLLLDSSRAVELYSHTRVWSKYGWYLSLLLCSEGRSLSDGRPLPGSGSWPGIPARSETLRGLLSRRTCRSFSPQLLTREQLIRIGSVGAGTLGARTVVCVYESGEVESGIFEFLCGDLARLGDAPSRSAVAQATVGQYPSSAAAITLWLLMPLSETDTSVDYQAKIIALGRAGHRICVACNDLGLGVFMTPALSEASTLELLGIDMEPSRVVPYLLSIGKRAE